MNRFNTILISLLFLTACITATYKETVTEWNSYQDVAKWLNSNFYFDKDRQRTVSQRLKYQGPHGLLARKPEKLFKNSTGYCVDSANFAIKTLNVINPNYNARWVFIKNALGQRHHWVTAFDHNGKLYIMDYGAGNKWGAMKGTHGPYNSLSEYRDFMATLNIPGFKAEDVFFRDMPGEED
jgi:hypothetical protein